MEDNTMVGLNPSMNEPVTISDKINELSYDGRAGHIFKIWLLNFFMNIVTLGIYKFWGKTRLRKYVAGSFLLSGDRFEYTGTGGEIFKGFLKAVPVLLLVYAPFMVASVLAEDGAGWPALLIFPIFIFFGIAKFAAVRYRLSRLRWRGIRGYMSGSAVKFGFFSLWRSFLSFITLGMLIPASDLARHRYMVERMYFGNVNADFEGSAKRLFWLHMLTYILFVPFIAALFIGGIMKAKVMIENAQQIQAEKDFYCESYMGYYRIEDPTQCPNLEQLRVFAGNNNLEYVPPAELQDKEPLPEDVTEESVKGDVSSMLVFYGLGYVVVIFMIIARLWYRAALTRTKFNGTTVGNIQFQSTVTGWAYFKLYFGNILLIIITLGLGKALTIQRNMAFFARHTHIKGDLDTSDILQAKDQKITVGEGMDDAFGLDTGLF